MAQTSEGALKVLASKAGIDAAEFRRLVESGQKWCMNCRIMHPVAAFGLDASRYDGRAPYCLESRSNKARARYVPRPPVRKGRVYVAPRDGDVAQARRRVNYLVEANLIPAPNELPCADCGHKWAEGERRHEYHHHNGYAAKHHEDVTPLCTTCHHERDKGDGR